MRYMILVYDHPWLPIVWSVFLKGSRVDEFISRVVRDPMILLAEVEDEFRLCCIWI